VNATETGMQTDIPSRDRVSSHGHLGERIFSLIDRELSPQDEAAAQDHLSSCHDCAEEHRRLAGAIGLVGGMGRVRAPEGFAARVLRRMRTQRRTGGLHSLAEQKVPYEGVVIVLLAAAAAVLLMMYAAPPSWNVFAHNTTAGAPKH